MSKVLVVFSDGTGNSSAKFFKTNVWRLYQAIDVRTPTAPDEPQQLVYYDDGVGTSSFKPLALLGGALGVGLMRNVMDLYRFVCRHYEPGDRIYAFGFSRGAFTIRVLVGLIAMMGVVKTRNESELHLLSEDAYRRFRYCFRLLGDRHLNGGTDAKGTGLTDFIVTPLRNWRDRRIAARRKRKGLPLLEDRHLLPVPHIDFVGVWDTVAAYGSPIAEITKGIDRWVWPLSMPDYKLSEKVLRARHALALDDERDTFHPLLWDEVHEQSLIDSGTVSTNRLRQVWFAGMHSDVGGGYAEEGLAHVSLRWMAEEAMAAGIRLRPGTLDAFELSANPLGPMHDSRAGFGSYYRYQPRKLSARIDPPDPSTHIVQDPDLKGRGMLKCVRIHQSVMRRIEVGTDNYAPIVLPEHYEVEGGAAFERASGDRNRAQEDVWDDVWRRRVLYFLTLPFTLCLILFPWWVPPPRSSCLGPQCWIASLLDVFDELLPAMLDPWLTAFKQWPGILLVMVAILLLLTSITRSLEHGLRDRMRQILVASMGAQEKFDTSPKAADRVRSIRMNPRYQSLMRMLKWRVGPGMAAGLIYSLVGIALLAMPIGVVGSVQRAQQWRHAFITQDIDPDRYVADIAPSEIPNQQCR